MARLGGLPLLVALAVVGSACSADTEPSETSNGSVPKLPKKCRGLAGLPDVAEVTFVTDGRLYAATVRGSKARCITDDVASSRVAWGGEADRVLIDGHRTRLIAPDAVASLTIEQQSTSWSRPTGTSVISVSPDGKLLKRGVDDGPPADISFLARHDEAIYHPAGTNIATVGEDGDGTYGLFVSDNVGLDHQIVAVAEEATRIYNLAFDHQGDTLYYAAEHEDRFDLHSLRITSEEVGDGGAIDARLGTLYSGPDDVTAIMVSEFSDEPLIAFQAHCRVRTISGTDESPLPGNLGQANTAPVGWLPDGALLVLEYANGCEGPGRLVSVAAEQYTVVAHNVTSAAPRAVLPPPPPEPPDIDTEVVA